MKLLNKVMPLIGVAATAATITPIMVSCGNNDQKHINYYSVDSWKYDSSITQKTGSVAAAKATETYFTDAMQNNNNILKNDILAKVQTELKSTTGYVNGGKFAITDLSVELNTSQTTKMYFVSFKILAEIKNIYSETKSDETYDYVSKPVIEIEVKGIPFEVVKGVEETGKHWQLQPVADITKYQNNWFFKQNIVTTSDVTITDDTGRKLKQEQKETKTIFVNSQNTVEFAQIPSYYSTYFDLVTEE